VITVVEGDELVDEVVDELVDALLDDIVVEVDASCARAGPPASRRLPAPNTLIATIFRILDHRHRPGNVDSISRASP
jgi:hypothetical protein